MMSSGKNALKEQWDLTEIEKAGRRAEAAKAGAAVLSELSDARVERIRPGKLLCYYFIILGK